MRNAASALGILGGLIAILIGVAAYGYTEVIYRWGEVPDWAELPANVDRVRAMSLIAPILGVVGGAVAQDRPIWGGLLLLAASSGLYWAFGLGLFTLFPIILCGLGGVLALLSPRRRPIDG